MPLIVSRVRRVVLLFAVVVAMAGSVRATEVRHEGENWILSNARLIVRVEPGPGRITVEDRAAGHTWVMPEGEGTALNDVAPEADGLSARCELWTDKGMLPVKVRLRVPDGGADLEMEAAAVDPARSMTRAFFLPPFVLETPTAALAVADYSGGHLYPLTREPFPARWEDGGRMDLPFVGVCDLEKGFGYALIVATSDDAVVESKPHKLPGGTMRPAPQVGWNGSKGTMAYPRKLIYRFCDKGGYVALAKAYRAYAKDQGLLVTLAEKAKANPNVAKLFGAVDVWGGSPSFAKEAHDAGIDRLLVQDWSHRADVIKQSNDLGYISSEYDNYTDIEPLKSPTDPVDSNHDLIPDRVVLKSDNQRMTAWLTYDKKTQFMKRCPAFWVPSAKVVIPKVLAEKPFLGRFIDVTSAEALYECFDPAHPLTHTDKRRCGEELLAYVRSQNLVVGGEHGIWWAVPYVDYFEGMMSGNRSFAWPAGHLIRPKSKTETYDGPYKPGGTWADYDRDGIGSDTRIPLWELVFHDCVVTTWYWGDATDFLSAVDPANHERKDAFNALYGTMPMLWADEPGSWTHQREKFVRTCKQVGAVHKAVATAELVDHAWLSADRTLQKTRFSNGVEVIANFGDKPQTVELQGRKYELAPNGYAAKGPGVDVKSGP